MPRRRDLTPRDERYGRARWPTERGTLQGFRPRWWDDDKLRDAQTSARVRRRYYAVAS